MKNFAVKKSYLEGSILIPSSKSHTMRALLFGLMGKGSTTIHHFLSSPDTLCMIDAIKSLGAKVTIFGNSLRIEGVQGTLKTADDVIDAGNSGIILRFIGALASLNASYTVITGDHSIRNQRPIASMLSGLNQLNVFAKSCKNNGYAPIILKGPLQGGKITLNGEDSQPVSALLIAASFAKHPTEIFVKNPGEKPWIDMTLHWLKFLKLPYKNHAYTHYSIPGKGEYKGFNYTVPSDFSSCAYPLVAALITQSEITLENIDMEDVQGDKKVIELLISMGAKILIDKTNKKIHVKKGSKLQGRKIDINPFIDAITILAVVGCFAEGETKLYNGAIARTKESDRIHAMASELKKMGANIEERKDGLTIHKSALKGACLKSYLDQRVAMSLTIAALAASGESSIEGIECIDKTYPNFAKDFQKLGASITV